MSEEATKSHCIYHLQLEIILEKSEQFDTVIAEDKHRESDLQLAEQGVPEDERGIAN